MDNKERRRQNLIKLSNDYDTQTEFATVLGISRSFLSQIMSPTDPRNIGDRLARKLETALGLNRFWLDETHEEPSAMPTNISIAKIREISESVDSTLESLGIELSESEREKLYRTFVDLYQLTSK